MSNVDELVGDKKSRNAWWWEENGVGKSSSMSRVAFFACSFVSLSIVIRAAVDVFVVGFCWSTPDTLSARQLVSESRGIVWKCVS